jgi:hypothetical protein
MYMKKILSYPDFAKRTKFSKITRWIGCTGGSNNVQPLFHWVVVYNPKSWVSLFFGFSTTRCCKKFRPTQPGFAKSVRTKFFTRQICRVILSYRVGRKCLGLGYRSFAEGEARSKQQPLRMVLTFEMSLLHLRTGSTSTRINPLWLSAMQSCYPCACLTPSRIITTLSRTASLCCKVQVSCMAWLWTLWIDRWTYQCNTILQGQLC